MSATIATMGTLQGISVIELGGIGPAPFCGMLLADMGADVIRVDRPSEVEGGLDDMRRVSGRSKKSIGIDLKSADGIDVLKRLLGTTDVLIEGFRPGVIERLGIGPDVCESINARLVIGRMTGWGQTGPYASMAGHDINYIGLAGPLGAIGRSGERPVPPLNLVGDYGGGALYLIAGILAALVERESSGRGQVVDVAMVDGVASLMTPTYQLFGMGLWSSDRESNLLDGAAPFYDTYETADGKSMAVGPIEQPFYKAMLDGLDIDETELPDRDDPTNWPALKATFTAAFKTRTRDEWEAIFVGTDACVTPVLALDEVASHPVNIARDVFVASGDSSLPAPAPRFSRTPSNVSGDAPEPGANTDEILTAVGYGSEEIAALRGVGAIS